MHKWKSLCTAIFTLMLASMANAQRIELTNLPQAAEHLIGKNIEVPDTATLKSAAAWISAIFSLPDVQALPAIRRLPTGKAILANAGNLFGWLPEAFANSSREMIALYDDATKTIYLSDHWNGSTPAEMSVLVHAMVRHFQNVGGQRTYDCPEERNALPYDAQERWLGLYGTSLSEEFKIDRATLMLITQCIP